MHKLITNHIKIKLHKMRQAERVCLAVRSSCTEANKDGGRLVKKTERQSVHETVS